MHNDKMNAYQQHIQFIQERQKQSILYLYVIIISMGIAMLGIAIMLINLLDNLGI